MGSWEFGGHPHKARPSGRLHNLRHSKPRGCPRIELPPSFFLRWKTKLHYFGKTWPDGKYFRKNIESYIKYIKMPFFWYQTSVWYIVFYCRFFFVLQFFPFISQKLFFPSFRFSFSNTNTHARMHARMHERTQVRTHTHTKTNKHTHTHTQMPQEV